MTDKLIGAALFEGCEAFVGVQGIRQTLQQASALGLDAGRGALPEPLWAMRGFQFTGQDAWRETVGLLDAYRPNTQMAVYVHVPFCDRRCPFCDCYSVPLSQRPRELDEYVDSLCTELRGWIAQGNIAARPISTVHFGGGTPQRLGPELLGRVVDEMRERLRFTRQTELAIETNSSLLSTTALEGLRAIGFSRLHVGVQSLGPVIRKKLGRRESSKELRNSLSRAVGSGFVVSADMLYGCPSQPLSAFLGDLTSILDDGIHGVSLYELQRTPRNDHFLDRWGERAKPLDSLGMFAAAHDLLLNRGLSKNHFCHFARPEDHNVYYRHAFRGEDLLAIGASADGSFGPLCYRYNTLADYRTEGLPQPGEGLQGCLLKTAGEARSDTIAATLMANELTSEHIKKWDLTELAHFWQRADLTVPGEVRHELSALGSWAINLLVSQVREAAGVPR